MKTTGFYLEKNRKQAVVANKTFCQQNMKIPYAEPLISQKVTRNAIKVNIFCNIWFLMHIGILTFECIINLILFPKGTNR